jgi:predicted aspartyl protease
MVTHGSVGPLKNLNFFVDTGASPTVVDSRVAKKLNLPAEGPADVIVVGGNTQGEETNLPSLEVGPVQLSNLQVTTIDLSFFQKTLPVRIDAIIGLDVLGKSPFFIDYSARVIRFGLTLDLPVTIPLRLDRGLAVLDAEIDHLPVHLLFDTGAPSVVLFSGVASQGSKVKVNANLGPESVGSFESKQVRLRTLRLGSEEFRREPALVAGNPKPSQFDFDGLISPVALGISRISVDLKGGVLAFGR